MSDEYKIFDSKGKTALALKDGRQLNQVNWKSCRILLSNLRFILATDDGKNSIPLKNIVNVGGRADVSQSLVEVTNYLTLHLENDNTRVIAGNSGSEELKQAFFTAVLDEKIVYIKHPAVEGGVITDETWKKARLNVEDTGLSLVTKDGDFIEIDIQSITNLDIDERTVQNDLRDILSVSHAEESTSVETYIASTDRRISFMHEYLKEGEEKNTVDNMEFTETEEEVLMALYSGVEPFEVPAFIDENIQDVEEIYEDLIERDIVDLVRERTEVTLTSRGRNLASESINEE